MIMATVIRECVIARMDSQGSIVSMKRVLKTAMAMGSAIWADASVIWDSKAPIVARRHVLMIAVAMESVISIINSANVTQDMRISTVQSIIVTETEIKKEFVSDLAMMWLFANVIEDLQEKVVIRRNVKTAVLRMEYV